MTRIHILTAGFTSPNGCAFLFPLIVFRRALKEAGYRVSLFSDVSPRLLDCDVLLIDSKFHRDRWALDTPAVLSEFHRFAEAGPRIVYCDTTDSSGGLMVELLPIVDVYAKAQLLADRSAYLQPIYGLRPFAEYYHQHFDAQDSAPEYSAAITDAKYLKKLRLSWNSGLADYSLFGPARMAAYYRLPLTALLRYPNPLAKPGRARPKDVSCRIGITYPRDSVAMQRRMIHNQISSRLETNKLSRRRYLEELKISKIVISPFGWGEITLKDFETFLTGGLLIKPDMSNVETWPNFYQTGETMLAHAWDLSDFDTVLERALTDYSKLQDIAERGQQRFNAHTAGPKAGSLFVKQFSQMLATNNV